MTETKDTPTQEQPATNGRTSLSLTQFLDGNTTPQTLDAHQAGALAKTIQEQWSTIDKTSVSAERLSLLREGIVQSKISISPEHAYEFLTLSLDLMKGVRQDNISTFVKLVHADSKPRPRKRAAEGSPERDIHAQELMSRMGELTAYMEQVAYNCEDLKVLIERVEELQLVYLRDKVSFKEAVKMCDRADQTIHTIWLELTDYAQELQMQADQNVALMERFEE